MTHYGFHLAAWTRMSTSASVAGALRADLGSGAGRETGSAPMPQRELLCDN